MKNKYFWVKYLDNWTIAEVTDKNEWFIPRYEESIKKEHFDKIVEKEIVDYDAFYHDLD